MSNSTDINKVISPQTKDNINPNYNTFHQEHQFLTTNNNIDNDNENQSFIKPNTSLSSSSLEHSYPFLQSLLSNIGFTYIHLLSVITSSLIFFAEGSEMISFNILIPILEKIFSNHNKYLLSMISSIFFIGYLLGTFFVGTTAKHLSRRKSILLSLSSISFFGITIVIFENIYFILLCRFIIGFFVGLALPQVFSNLFETLPPHIKYKELFIFSVFIFARCGYIYFLVMYSFFQANWRVSFILAVVPILISTVAAYLFIEDSILMKFNKQQLNEVVKSINNFHSILNISPLNNNDITTLDNEIRSYSRISKNSNDFSYLMLFKPTYIKVSCLIITIMAMTSMISFTNIYSLPIILSNLNDSYNVGYMVISHIVTIPAVVIAAFVTRVIGRKGTMLCGLMCCGLMGVVTSIREDMVVMVSSMINFWIVFCLCSGRLFIMECFPTKLRDISLAVVMAFAKVGDSLTPFISDFLMERMLVKGPFLQISVLSVIGVVAIILLPFDTKGKITE